MRERTLVLLVDDEEIFLEIAAMQLRASGFDAEIARGFAEGLSKAESLQPDVILSDIYMPPGPSGWDLAFALYKNPATRDIKFAFFTSLRDPWSELAENQRAIAKAQFSQIRFFSKTGDLDELVKGMEALTIPNQKS